MHSRPRILRGADTGKAPSKAALFVVNEEIRKEYPGFLSAAYPASQGDYQIKGSQKLPVKKFLGVWALTFALLLGLSSVSQFSPVGVKEIASVLVPFITEPATADSEIVEPIEVEGNISDFAEPRIAIPAISVDAPLLFPESRELAVLNEALAKGAVHYPGSALPGETGNLFIFGHSTGLAVVNNKNYKLFNRAKELKPGDAVKVRSGNREYLYLVKKNEVKTADDTAIDLRSDKKIMTISTCRIIGGKESRYVITAEFLRSYPLRSQPTPVDTSSKS